MSQHESSSTEVNVTDGTAMMAEYNTLRSEISQRIGFRFQIINLILIVAGTFLTAGVQPNTPASVLLVYPLLALFLTISWAHNGMVLTQIGRYIKDNIESKTPGLHWETSGTRLYSTRRLGTLSTSGVILTTQLLAVGLAFIKGNFTIIEMVLLACSIAAIILTLILLRYSTGIWRHT